MDERGGVDELDGRRGAQQRFGQRSLRPAAIGGDQHEQGTQPLAARRDRARRGLGDTRRVGLEHAGEVLLDRLEIGAQSGATRLEQRREARDIGVADAHRTVPTCIAMMPPAVSR